MQSLQLQPKDSIFSLFEAFKKDLNPNKINLGIGSYTAEDGSPFVLPIVQTVAKQLQVDNFNYLPIEGNAQFLQNTGSLIFSKDAFKEEDFAMQATCGGTHACSLFAELASLAGVRNMILPTPTWVNHKSIFSYLNILEIPHLNELGEFNVQGYESAISEVKVPTVLLLHGGPTHNPTGINFIVDDLTKLIPIIKDRPIYVLIDFAYFGLGKSAEEDSAGARLLVRELPNIAVAFSYSKNATLYCQRTGALFVKTQEKEIVESNLQHFVRKSISNTPAFGQKIINAVFKDRKNQWLNELDEMRSSIDNRRQSLVEALEGRVDYLKGTSGMFGLLKLQQGQIDALRNDFSIYLPNSGRICFGGVRLSSIDYLYSAFSKVI